MYINPIHAGPVAFAEALVHTARTQTEEPGRRDAEGGTARSRRFGPLQRLAWWWRQLDEVQAPVTDPVQLMMWGDCGGRPHASALSGFLLLVYLRQKRSTSKPE